MSGSHDPSRFNTYTPLKDGSGFTLKGSSFVFKFDRYGGWFDESGNYYNENAQPDEPPSDSEEHYDNESHSDGSNYSDDPFDKQYGLPPKNEQEDEEDYHSGYHHHHHIEKFAGNLEILQNYPQGKPFRVHFQNMSYFSKRSEVFSHFQSKVKGLVNVVFLENQRKQFNGNGYFVVEDVKAGEELVKLEGEIISNRPVRFKVQHVEVMLQKALQEDDFVQDFRPKHHQHKKYLIKEKNNDTKPYAKVEEKVEDKKVQKEVKPELVKASPIKAETVKVEPVKVQAVKVQAVKAVKVESAKVEPVKVESAKVQAVKVESAKVQAVKVESKVEKQKKYNPVRSFESNPQQFCQYKFIKTAFPKKSSFKQWLYQNHFDHEKDLKTVQKIEGNQMYALVTMKRKVYNRLNGQFYLGQKIQFHVQ